MAKEDELDNQLLMVQTGAVQNNTGIRRTMFMPEGGLNNLNSTAPPQLGKKKNSGEFQPQAKTFGAFLTLMIPEHVGSK